MQIIPKHDNLPTKKMAPIFLKINPNLVPKFPIPSQSRSHKLLTVLLHSFNIYGISPNHHRRQLPSPPSTCLVISVGISPSPVRTLLFRCCHSQSLCRRCRTIVPVQVKQVADLAGKSEIHQFFSFSGEFEYRVRENKLEGSFLCWLKKSVRRIHLFHVYWEKLNSYYVRIFVK